MINLELLDACNNCSDFKAVSNCEHQIISVNYVEHCHTVSCVNMEKCKALLRHLEKEVKKDGN